MFEQTATTDQCPQTHLSPGFFFDASETVVSSFGMMFRAGENLLEPLEKAGFINVDCKILKVPIGTWPKAWTCP